MLTLKRYTIYVYKYRGSDDFGKTTCGHYHWFITVTVPFTVSLGKNEFWHDENWKGGDSTQDITEISWILNECKP